MLPPQLLNALNENKTEANRAARIAMARRCAENFRTWGAWAILTWGQCLFPDKFPLPFCLSLHSYLVDIRYHPFTATLAPRFHSKTTVKGFLVPIFQAIYEPALFLHYLHIQATDEKALAVNRSIRAEFEENQDLIALIGDLKGARWADRQFVLKSGVCFTAVSAGQSIRGLNYRNHRPDYLMPDDLYNEDDINNPESTEKKNDWFKSTLYPARAQGRRCSIQFIGTKTNKLDLFTHFEAMPDVLTRTFKAVINDEKKIVLWPEKNTYEQLMIDKKIMGTNIFMREMQNEPRDEATSIIKHSWLYKTDGRNWEFDPHELFKEINAPGAKRYIASVRLGNDPSIGKKNDSDFTGTALVIETRMVEGGGSDFWILDIFNEHLSMEKRTEQLVAIAKDQPAIRSVTDVRIEAIGAFDDYATFVIQHTNLPVTRVEWVTDKITNLENRSHFFENEKVHISRLIPKEKIDTLVYQLTTNYPNHDDMRDAVLLTMDLETESWARFMR